LGKKDEKKNEKVKKEKGMHHNALGVGEQ